MDIMAGKNRKEEKGRKDRWNGIKTSERVMCHHPCVTETNKTKFVCQRKNGVNSKKSQFLLTIATFPKHTY